ncbi:unnamed protein product [Cunninghamella blakesleeana]
MKKVGLSSLPTIVSRFLGYRKPNHHHHTKKLPTWRICLWTFIAAWLGIAVLEIIGTYSPQLNAYHSPVVIASFGASAVLIYGSIDVPLAQPRNVFFGHLIGALVGVIVNKLFTEVPNNYSSWSSNAEKEIVQWVAGATAVSLAIVLMQLTVTVHPPGGATALIATVDQKVIAMGWYYIGVIAMSAVIQLIIACLINNIDRKYPNYWWRPDTSKIVAPTMKTILPTPVHQSPDHNVIIEMNDDSDSDDNNNNDNNENDNNNNSNNNKKKINHHQQNSEDLSISTAVSSSSESLSNPITKIILDPSKPLNLPSIELLDEQDILQLEAIYKKLSCTK